MTKNNRVTRTFTRDQIQEWGLPFEGGDLVVKDEMLDHTRWSILHELIFRAPDDGKLWYLIYQLPATEYQECDRWPSLEAVEMEAYIETVTSYREVVDGDKS